MGVGRGRSSSEPGTSTGGAASIKMKATSARDGRIAKERGNGEGLDFAREGSLGGGIGFGVNAGTGRDGSSENLLSGSEAAPLIDVHWIKVRPDRGAEVATGGKAGDVSGRSVLMGRPGADPTRGDAERGKAPVIIRKGRANQTPKGKADIRISGY